MASAFDEVDRIVVIIVKFIKRIGNFVLIGLSPKDTIGSVSDLAVNRERMRANLDAMRATLTKAAAYEWFDPGLARHAGELALAQLAGLQGQ